MADETTVDEATGKRLPDRPRDKFGVPLDDKGRGMTFGQYQKWQETGELPPHPVIQLLFGPAPHAPDAMGKALAWAAIVGVVGGGVWLVRKKTSRQGNPRGVKRPRLSTVFDRRK